MRPESLAEAVQRLSTLGFRHSLRANGGKLCDASTGQAYDPGLLQIEETLRFEGESDPDEQAILFALRDPGGMPMGIYSAVFGPSMPPEDVAVVRHLGAKK